MLLVGLGDLCCSGEMLSRDEMMELNHLKSRLPHMSASALAAIVAEFNRTRLSSHCKRKHIREAREMMTNAVTPYGTLHQTVPLITTTGASTQLIVQHPFAMLHMATEGGGEFASFLERKMMKSPTHAKTLGTLYSMLMKSHLEVL